MSGKGIGGHHRSPLSWLRSGGDDWVTPKWIIDALGPFDLDPCCPDVMPWKTAPVMYTKKDDGLAQDWDGAFVWCNPPYGRSTGKWLQRMAEHGNGIALVFARTETEMFHVSVWCHATAVLFLRGRLEFLRPDGKLLPTSPNRRNNNAGGPSVLIAYGLEAVSRLRRCGVPGTLVELHGNVDIIPGRCTKRGDGESSNA